MYWYLVALFYAFAGARPSKIWAEMVAAIKLQQEIEWYWAHNTYDLPHLTLG